MIKARHILETVLYAEDLAAARHFYGEVLGLPVYQEVDKRLVFFRCAARCFWYSIPRSRRQQISRERATGPWHEGQRPCLLSQHACRIG